MFYFSYTERTIGIPYAVFMPESSQTLPARDAVELLRVVALAALVHDPRRRVIVALNALCQSLKCDMISAAQSHINPATGATHFEEMILCGELPEQRKDEVLAYLGGDHSSDLFYAAFGHATAQAVAKNPRIDAVVYRRQDLVSDADWYPSEHVRTTRARIGVDAAIYAGLPTRQLGVWVGAGFHRCVGQPQFTEVERELVRIFLLGSRPLFEAFHGAGKASGPFLAKLTPRQRELIFALMQGFSAKEIAARMGLSVHSVNTYCNRLFRQLNISGRGELIRLCQDRGVFIHTSSSPSPDNL